MSCKCKIVRHTKLLFVYLLFLQSCNSASIINPDTPLTDDGDFLVSEGKNFALGFFSPDNTSSRRYVGIWYYKVSIQTVVWVANRDNPIANNSGVLSFDKSTGNLVLFDRQKPDVFLWSTNISNSLANVNSNHTAELLDSGNFVVHAVDGSEEFLWQSFDFPTDTLLPGMKLGVDRRSGLNRFLTSWKSSDNPGIGSYTYMIDVNASVPQLFLYKNRDPYWRAGPWNGLRWSGIPELTTNIFLNSSYVDTPEEVSVIYGIRDPPIISRLVSTGMIQRLMWHQDTHTWVNFWSSPGEQCDYFSHCGAFTNCNPDNGGEYECKCLLGFEPKSAQDWYLRDSSQGCVRKQESKVCGNGEGFIKLERVKLPDTTKARLDMNLDHKACEDLCLKNCLCSGYSAANLSRGSFSGCITFYNELVDLREYPKSGQDFYLRADAIELANYSKKKKRSHVNIKVLLIVLSAAVLAVLILPYWLFMKKKKRGVAQTRRDAIELFTSSNIYNRRLSVHGPQMGEEVNEMETSTIEMKLYPLSTIIATTENFSPAHKIGEGGFGSVYKGKLHYGQEIAVKRLSNTSGQGIEEFRNEVTLIAKLQHKNLVRLFGFCIHKEEKMLIYEYLPNRGLDCFLFDDEKKYILDWEKRFDIALGIARGMVYLHHDSRLRIIHRDLKASNVLLDTKLNPKISDFGMARIFGGDQLQETTKRVVGTYGYMAPEYAMGGHFSIKSDVFSFGVLLLEIVIGIKNSNYHTEKSINLIGHVWDLWKESKVLEVVDQSLGESHEHDPKILRCIHIGLLCVQESAKARPSMSEVVYMLCNDTSLPAPGQAAFILRTSNRGYRNKNSVNELTISKVEGR